MKTLANAMSFVMLAVLVAIVTMLAALFSPAMAQARLWEKMLPPPEYDNKLYRGTMTVTRLTADRIAQVCAETKSLTACSSVAKDGSWCSIIIADDETLRAQGLSFELVMRHEKSHCLGWPKDHPGGTDLVIQPPYPTRVTNPFTGKPM